MVHQLEAHRSFSSVHPLSFEAIQNKTNWLHDYEKLEGSIFNYYSIHNEIEFLKKIDSLPSEKKQFYLQENIKRFLGEFVGKVPYTTIPYDVDKNGISFAGIYVMDSYRKAAENGSLREQAETAGFQNIEATYVQSLKDAEALPIGAWISPPKTADYGFVFVFIPDGNGKIKEYILRYPERLTALEKSKDLYSLLSPATSVPQDSNEFLTQPLFDRSNQKSPDILQSVMKEVGINERKIQESKLFEQTINSTLGKWIDSYTSLIQSLALYEKNSPFYNQGILQAKKILLSIYQKAQEIQFSITESTTTQFKPYVMVDVPISQAELYNYAALLQQQKELPTTSGGSCPAIQSPSDPFSSSFPFMDNLLALTTLTKGTPLEKAFQNAESFPCPKCGEAIASGKGIEVCPHCGISKQEYAKLVNGLQCD